jgi:phosphoserine phosphatase
MPNVYDWDDTVVVPNSGVTFVAFCMWRYNELLRYLPHAGRALLKHRVKARSGKPFRAELYTFMRDVPDWEETVCLFWELKADAMLQPWYLAQKRPDDIIISDSADFMLRPLCDKLGVRLLATPVDPVTGLLTGPDCYGPEKLRRLREDIGDVDIEEFYSESLHDEPLARAAKKAFLVKKGERLPWPFKKQ